MDLPPMTDKPNQYPANALWVELSTRITTQRLHYRSGNEETAASSVHKLFDKTRELMEKHPDAKAFQVLALQLLNDTLRPYTARWHGWMTETQVDDKSKLVFKNNVVRRKFRNELNALRTELVDYQKQFRVLADGGEATDATKVPSASETPVLTAKLGGGIIAGLKTNTENDVKADINAIEHKEIYRRRIRVGIETRPDIIANIESEGYELPPINSATGLALSGGGIRSATFCLGIVQVLAQRKLFKQFDYLSTVSGGGYLGSFLSSTLANSTEIPAKDADAKIETILGKNEGKETSAVHHLRNSSKYLGSSGAVWMGGIMVFGILSNLLLLLPIPLTAALVVYLLQHVWHIWGNSIPPLTTCFGIAATPVGYGLLTLATVSLVLGIFLPFIQSIAQGKYTGCWAKLRGKWESATLIAAGLTLVLALLYWLPPSALDYQTWENPIKNPTLWLTMAICLPIVSFALAKRLNATALLQNMVIGLFILSGPLFFGLVFLVACHFLRLGDVSASEPVALWRYFCFSATPDLRFTGLFLATALLSIWSAGLVNINTLSPHRYYRNRLSECYLLEHNPLFSKVFPLSKASEWKDCLKNFKKLSPDHYCRNRLSECYLLRNAKHGVTPRLTLPLADLNPTKSLAPYHLINTTLNLTTSELVELRGRHGDFFMFSKHYCGSPLLGYFPTADIVKNDPHIDLGTAMAISGAAVSTNMGAKSIASLRFLIALMNIRLGYWLRHPNTASWIKPLEGAGGWYLLKEIFGCMSEKDRYLNLSDGGHIENLAAYELLRRRCKFIVCVDGGQEPGMECADLIRLQHFAAIDLGTQLTFDLSDLQLDKQRHTKAYAILVKIHYPNNALGWMLYMKLAATGTEPEYVSDYRRTHPDFPHETTGDQFFDEAQFEAYRMLGECAGESLLHKELLEEKQPTTLDAWFQCLANNLLPDNDEVFKNTG